MGGAYQVLMEEAQKLKFVIHLGTMKMNQNLRIDYCGPCIKQEVASYVESKLTCQKVKAEHHRPNGKLQSLDI